MRRLVASLSTTALVAIGGFFGASGAVAAMPGPEPAPPAPPSFSSSSSTSSFPAFPTFPPSPTFPSFPAPTPIPNPFPTPAYPTVMLTGDTLTVAGTTGDEIVSIFPRDIVTNPASQVRGGTTSVGLDLALLEQAAGLTLTGANTPGRPATSDFLVGFPILPTTDFRYSYPEFAPVSGVIRHTGTVTFNGSTTIGNFDIGFDPARATDGRSGFFVRSTTGVTGILFDLGAPSSVSAAINRLAVGSTPLLVSPEFAGILGNPALTGAAIGAARIDALSTPSAGRLIEVNFTPSLFQPIKTLSFPASQIRNIVVSLGAGSNSFITARIDLQGELRVTGGAARDTVQVSEFIGGALQVDTAAGNDFVRLSSIVSVTTGISLGDGFDTLDVVGSLFTGARAAQGGAGSDNASLTRTDLTRDALNGFEFITG